MFTEKELENKIIELQKAITAWATKNHVWLDSIFKKHLDHFNDEPNEIEACVTVLCAGNYMCYVLQEEYVDLANEFHTLIEKLGFWYEMEDGATACFYTNDENLNKAYLEYFEWQWICRLIEPNYTSLYSEIFEHFTQNPQKFYSLEPRKLEVLVSEIFRNQGYYTELGPGQNDGGVDLRIYQKDDIDQITTLVQVKRYKQSLPVKLESVAALKAIVDEEKANRGLFITTSRYLPQAKKFAARQQRRLKLADTTDLKNWCDKARTIIVRDKSQIIEDDYIRRIIETQSLSDFCGRIVRASIGYNTVRNDFCLVLKDGINAALLMRLPTKAVKYYDTPHNFRGEEIPLLEGDFFKHKHKDGVFRASKSVSETGETMFWGQRHLYYLWDGKPQYFDWID